jgi:hypothetical protein
LIEVKKNREKPGHQPTKQQTLKTKHNQPPHTPNTNTKPKIPPPQLTNPTKPLNPQQTLKHTTNQLITPHQPHHPPNNPIPTHKINTNTPPKTQNNKHKNLQQKNKKTAFLLPPANKATPKHDKQ